MNPISPIASISGLLGKVVQVYGTLLIAIQGDSRVPLPGIATLAFEISDLGNVLQKLEAAVLKIRTPAGPTLLPSLGSKSWEVSTQIVDNLTPLREIMRWE